jgi:sugar/nucleoside kinase (ribokinase family)
LDREGIALAGNMILDYYKEIDVYPAHSTLASIRKVSRETGGLVCNCAQAISRIDSTIPLRVIGRIGDDEAGQFIRAKLGRFHNIDFERLKVDTDTSFTDAMIDVKNKTRTYFQYRGANANLGIDDFGLAALKVRILHVGYILLLDSLDAADSQYGTAMARLLHDAQTYGIKTSIDVVSEDSDRFTALVPAALKYTDYAIINEYEAARTTGIAVRDQKGTFMVDQAFDICEKMLAMGVSTWAIVHSREGAVGMTAAGRRVALPALDIPRQKIVSTIGAGDAFLSGCLHQAYQSRSLDQAIRVGIAAASTSLLSFNATDGIRPAAELAKFYEQTPKEAWPGF